jgi:hypothetical protein
VLERTSNPNVFKGVSLDEQMLEINHGVTTNRENEEARRREEIKSREETEQRAIQEEKAILH